MMSICYVLICEYVKSDTVIQLKEGPVQLQGWESSAWML